MDRTYLSLTFISLVIFYQTILSVYGLYTSLYIGREIEPGGGNFLDMIQRESLIYQVFLSFAVSVICYWTNYDTRLSGYRSQLNLLSASINTNTILMMNDWYGFSLFYIFAWLPSILHFNNSIYKMYVCLINIVTFTPTLLAVGGYKSTYMYYGVYLSIWGVIETEDWAYNFTYSLTLVLMWVFGYYNLEDSLMEENLWNILLLLLFTCHHHLSVMMKTENYLLPVLIKHPMSRLTKNVICCNKFANKIIWSKNYYKRRSSLKQGDKVINVNYDSPLFENIKVDGLTYSITMLGEALVFCIWEKNKFINVSLATAVKIKHIMTEQISVLDSYREYPLFAVGHCLSLEDLGSIDEYDYVIGGLVIFGEYSINLPRMSLNSRMRYDLRLNPRLILHNYLFFKKELKTDILFYMQCDTHGSTKLMREALGSSALKRYSCEVRAVCKLTGIKLVKTGCFLADKRYDLGKIEKCKNVQLAVNSEIKRQYTNQTSVTLITEEGEVIEEKCTFSGSMVDPEIVGKEGGNLKEEGERKKKGKEKGKERGEEKEEENAGEEEHEDKVKMGKSKEKEKEQVEKVTITEQPKIKLKVLSAPPLNLVRPVSQLQNPSSYKEILEQALERVDSDIRETAVERTLNEIKKVEVKLNSFFESRRKNLTDPLSPLDSKKWKKTLKNNDSLLENGWITPGKVFTGGVEETSVSKCFISPNMFEILAKKEGVQEDKKTDDKVEFFNEIDFMNNIGEYKFKNRGEKKKKKKKGETNQVTKSAEKIRRNTDICRLPPELLREIHKTITTKGKFINLKKIVLKNPLNDKGIKMGELLNISKKAVRHFYILTVRGGKKDKEGGISSKKTIGKIDLRSKSNQKIILMAVCDYVNKTIEKNCGLIFSLKLK